MRLDLLIHGGRVIAHKPEGSVWSDAERSGDSLRVVTMDVAPELAEALQAGVPVSLQGDTLAVAEPEPVASPEKG